MKISHNVEPRQQAGALLIANMGDPMVFLFFFFSGTRNTIQGTTTIRDGKAKHGQGKTTNLHHTALLEAILHKDNIGKR